jgi:hypothetical protein
MSNHPTPRPTIMSMSDLMDYYDKAQGLEKDVSALEKKLEDMTTQRDYYEEIVSQRAPTSVLHDRPLKKHIELFNKYNKQKEDE